MRKLCVVRDILNSLSDFEQKFFKEHSICLNEGMIICCLESGRLSSGEIAERVNLTCSNTSKLLRSVEEKGFITRVLGERDKRQMYFELTDSGNQKLNDIESIDIDLTYPLDSLVKLLIDGDG